MEAELKVGRRIVKIKVGDYLFDNGACIQLVAGDGRKLYYDHKRPYDRINSIVISKRVFNKGVLKQFKDITGWDDVNSRYKDGRVYKRYVFDYKDIQIIRGT